ncbi:MAG: hypothetical protein R6V01_01525 [Thermoplasmatota archaeon]
MKKKYDLSDMDRLIIEMLSFKLYKKGKQPLLEIDPRERIKRGIWTDMGVDLDRLSSAEDIPTNTDGARTLLDIGSHIVRKGLLRKKIRHELALDMVDLESIPLMSEGFGAHEKGGNASSEFASSSVLHPLMEIRTSEGLRQASSLMRYRRPLQTEFPDISPSTAFRTLEQGRKGKVGSDDISNLFDRKVNEENWLRISRTETIKDLGSLIEFVLRASDKSLKKAVGADLLKDFSTGALRSSYLEAFWSDIEPGVPGDEIRERFGRFLMEGPLSERTYGEVVLPRMEHLTTCSPKEAQNIGKELAPVMDSRSSKYLQEIVFRAPPKNRPSIIDLLGATGDSSAAGTLKRLKDYSTVDKDRRKAAEALKELRS